MFLMQIVLMAFTFYYVLSASISDYQTHTLEVQQSYILIPLWLFYDVINKCNYAIPIAIFIALWLPITSKLRNCKFHWGRGDDYILCLALAYITSFNIFDNIYIYCIAILMYVIASMMFAILINITKAQNEVKNKKTVALVPGFSCAMALFKVLSLAM